MAFVLEFIAIPVALWLKIRQFKQVYGIDSRQTEWEGSRLKTLLMNQHVTDNSVLLFIILLLAIVSAYAGFSVLHANENVKDSNDKKTIFVTALTSSLLLYCIPMLINIAISTLVAAFYKCFHYELLLGYILAAFTYILYYVLVYLVVSIAIIMTGTFGTSVLYFLFLCFIESFLSTTKFYGYIREHELAGSIILWGIAVFIGWLSWYLYKKRPEVLDKKAFAFPLAEKITKYLIVVFLSFYLGAAVNLSFDNSVIGQILRLVISCLLLGFVADCAFSKHWKDALKNWKDFFITVGITLILYFIF